MNADDQHRITLLDSGESFDCRELESVLNGLARLGRRGIPTGCRGGGCGVCKVEVVAGRYASLPMSRDHVSADDERCQRVLACRILPRDDLSLRVIGKLRKAITPPVGAA